jgi:hypothetical protein
MLAVGSTKGKQHAQYEIKGDQRSKENPTAADNDANPGEEAAFLRSAFSL